MNKQEILEIIDKWETKPTKRGGWGMDKKYVTMKGTKLVKKWVKPYKVKGHYRMIKINVNVRFKLKQQLTTEGEGKE